MDGTLHELDGPYQTSRCVSVRFKLGLLAACYFLARQHIKCRTDDPAASVGSRRAR